MDQVTPYEQLIAEKLDQLPVPDMADSIWAGIDAQLDAPPDVPAKKTSLKMGGKGLYVLIGAAAMVALLLWWWYGRKDNRPVPAPTPVEQWPVESPAVEPPPAGLPPAGPPPVKDSHTSEKPARKKNIPVIPGVGKKDTILFQPVPRDSVRIDPSFLQKSTAPLPDVDLYRDAPRPTGKKHKGVKGITDDDYKISAGKDSAKKRS